MTTPTELFDAVFGKDSKGATAELRALSSKQRFVRSQHQLSLHRENATGRILNAAEALRLFGWPKLQQLADRNAVPIAASSDEPYNSIIQQLSSIGVEFSKAAQKSRWSPDSIRRFEERKQVPFRDLERMAQGIDLNEEKLGTVSSAGADHQLGVRLRTMRSSDPNRFSESTVLGLTEAAWTIRKQLELASLTNEDDRAVITKLGISPSSDYGSKLAPAYQIGYRLARETRKLLGLNTEVPIDSLKDLIEKRLRIPVVQLELHSDFAGATVASDGSRGIVINLAGDNSNPLVRRMTMAHELGHILWDPDQNLNKLRVDRYDQLKEDAADDNYPLDYVERRANAFAIEFLAPGDAIVDEFKKSKDESTGLEKLITTFGVSRTAIARHLSNSSHKALDVSSTRTGQFSTDDWEVRESLAVPVFAPQDVPISRRGRFAYLVYKAFKARLISADTAASLYRCKPNELQVALTSTENFLLPS
jgi:Zn-dependent peptidase ImmA (M78 family)